jgi:mono/diheme cytochrome c family protein
MKNYVENLANVIFFALILATSQQVFARSGGIDGYSGDPATNSGDTCAATACHSGGVTPSIDLRGPVVVRPGTTSNYTLTISGGQQNSGGLDIRASAGTLISMVANTKLQNGELTHTARAAAVSGTVAWNFSWRAPTALGSYTIYSAGLSTNANSNPTGDGVANIATAVTVSSAAPQPPTAVIHAPLTAPVGVTVSFDGSASYDPDGIVNQYAWNFGDGSTANGAHVINSYATAGVYTVTLTVTDSDNLTHTTFQDITVGGLMLPVADPGGPYTGTVNQPVNFDASQSTHVTAIVRYIWDFADVPVPVVEAVAVPTISHTYDKPGAYTVTLAVQDANNVTGVASTVVVINALPATDGPTLYANNCQGCHNPLASSTKLNRTATQIQSAITANAGGVMGSLSGLTSAQIQAIATALVSVTPPPPPTDGPTLYANNCQGCHGPLATSSKLNRTAAQIQTAITYNAGNVMGTLSGLTPTQISAIATALVSATSPPPTDGPTLYAVNCSGCHGPLTTSSKLNRSATQIQTAITNNAGGVMGSLSGLTSTQIQAIATALVSTTTPPPTDGPTLYTINCSGCHGPLATSSKLNRSATQIQTAITGNAGNVMSSLSGLTSTQISAIATALVSVTPPPPPTDGATLYANNCQSCHGALATSSKLNRTATQIQTAITGNAGNVMGSLSGLTSTQIQAIATALVSVTPPPPPATDGATLYANNCQSCHGPLATSSKLNRSATQIQSAITNNAGGVMGSLSGLTTTQIQAIATALVSVTPPPPPATDGATLYANNCQSCHGPLATSSKLNRSATQIQSAINNNAGGVMGSLSGLTAAQVQAIATALAGSAPPPTTGEGLYNTYCLACHGPGGRGGQYKNVTGASTSEISGALNSVRLMNSITLNSSQIKNISDYLNGVSTPPPPATDGATLYSNNCASCHGALATSTKLNRTATQITNAIGSVGQMNSINLTATQITAIANALVSTTTPPPSTDGAALYGTYCQSCHGTLATSSKLNRTATQISNAIANVSQMSSISLTSTQIQSIATALGSITPVPTTGEGLYNSYCSSCHGAGGRGGTYESVRGATTSSITSAISGVQLMRSISLTPGQKQAIATYLSGSSGGGGD